MDKILVIDVETTGFSRGDDVTKNHQILSIGLIVSDADFNAIEKFYCEVKWNGSSHWQSQAESIHGLSKEYLEQNGLEEEDAVAEIMTFIYKHYEPDEPIYFMGHNCRNFDVPFLVKLINKYDMDIKVGHRTIDSFSVGMVCFATKDSNELFSMFYPKRANHNALTDAEMCLGICRKTRRLMEKVLNG